MVGIADIISDIKYAWNAYWIVHLSDATYKWLNGTITIFINDDLDDDLSLSQNYWDEWSPGEHKGNWSLLDLMVAAWGLANAEISSVYNSIDSWEPPTHIYMEIPRKSGPGPRLDLADPVTAFTTLIGYVGLAVEMLLASSGLIESIRTAILNLDPAVATTDEMYYEDPANPGTYSKGKDCTPTQQVSLSDLACWYGIIYIFVKYLKPIMRTVGRAGLLFIRMLKRLLFKMTKSTTTWIKNRMSREKLIHAITDNMKDAITDAIETDLDALEVKVDKIAELIGLRLTL